MVAVQYQDDTVNQADESLPKHSNIKSYSKLSISLSTLEWNKLKKIIVSSSEVRTTISWEVA